MTNAGRRTVADVAKTLDHAVLKPEFSRDDLAKHAAMCVARGVGCLCVRSCDVAAAAKLVAGSPVVVASVIGFPHGAQRPEVKALEARHAIADGARELDMVINVGSLKSGDDAAVRGDIAAVVAEAKPKGVVVKVILETCYLTPGEIAAACRLAEAVGADFVKTSTGFGVKPSGPTVSSITRTASGGIRTWDDAVRYLDMGCTRIGVGDAAAILDGGPAKVDAAY